MQQDLILPDTEADEITFAEAVRLLRDHLIAAVEVDQMIRLGGVSYRITWGDRRPTFNVGPDAEFWMTSGMRVVDGRGAVPPEVLPTGEEQITLAIDGERLVFHLVATENEPPLAPEPKKLSN